MEIPSLFHNRVFGLKATAGQFPCLLLFCLLAGVGVCAAQESADPAASKDATEAGDSGVMETPAGEPSSPDEGRYRTLDILYPEPDGTPRRGDEEAENMPIPVPIEPVDENEQIGGQSFVDDVLRSPRNTWGFTLAAYQAYTNDISETDRPRQSSGITSFMPRVFFNFGKRKSRFHFDAGAGYRTYNQYEGRDSWDYSGNASYSRVISKDTTFRLSNQFTSSYNDAWSFLSLHSPLDYDWLSSNEVLFNRQRINRNSLRAKLDHRISRKAEFGLSGGHRWYDYPQEGLQDSQALEAGANFRYQLADWVYMASSVTTYLNLTDANSDNARIYHLQFGGLEFRLSDSWRTWAGGGIDIYDRRGPNRMSEHINAGIGYNSLMNSFNVTYQRGFSSAIGLSRVLITDVVNAGFGRRITGWMSGNLNAYYYRSKEPESIGTLETFSGGGGLGFALRRDLSLSLNAAYQNQKPRDFPISGLQLSRLTGYAGLHYVWPSRER